MRVAMQSSGQRKTSVEKYWRSASVCRNSLQASRDEPYPEIQTRRKIYDLLSLFEILGSLVQNLLVSSPSLWDWPSILQNLSLIHISEPTRRTPISYAVFC